MGLVGGLNPPAKLGEVATKLDESGGAVRVVVSVIEVDLNQPLFFRGNAVVFQDGAGGVYYALGPRPDTDPKLNGPEERGSLRRDSVSKAL